MLYQDLNFDLHSVFQGDRLGEIGDSGFGHNDAFGGVFDGVIHGLQGRVDKSSDLSLKIKDLLNPK